MDKIDTLHALGYAIDDLGRVKDRLKETGANSAFVADGTMELLARRINWIVLELGETMDRIERE